MPYPALPERLLAGVVPRSPCAYAARAALELAQAFHAEFEWLHVREADGPHGIGHAAPGRALAAHAAKVRADMIVLGPHMKHGHLDFGSTARSVLSRFDGTVWVQSQEWRPVRRILVGTDLSDPSLQAVHRAHAVARALGASLTVLHGVETFDLAYGSAGAGPVPGRVSSLEAVRASARLALERAFAGFDWEDVPHELRFAEGPPASTLLAHQAEHDVLAVGSHGRGLLLPALLGSVTRRVLQRAYRPVVVFCHARGRHPWPAPDARRPTRTEAR